MSEQKDWRREEAEHEIVVSIRAEERQHQTHNERLEQGVRSCVEGACNCFGDRDEERYGEDL